MTAKSSTPPTTSGETSTTQASTQASTQANTQTPVPHASQNPVTGHYYDDGTPISVQFRILTLNGNKAVLAPRGETAFNGMYGFAGQFEMTLGPEYLARYQRAYQDDTPVAAVFVIQAQGATPGYGTREATTTSADTQTSADSQTTAY